MNTEPRFGDRVVIPLGMSMEAIGTVREVYGPPTRRHVIVLLTPEISGPIVDEETTIAMPLDLVSKAPAVA